jgi:hypothetical protein
MRSDVFQNFTKAKNRVFIRATRHVLQKKSEPCLKWSFSFPWTHTDATEFVNARYKKVFLDCKQNTQKKVGLKFSKTICIIHEEVKKHEITYCRSPGFSCFLYENLKDFF